MHFLDRNNFNFSLVSSLSPQTLWIWAGYKFKLAPTRYVKTQILFPNKICLSNSSNLWHKFALRNVLFHCFQKKKKAVILSIVIVMTKYGCNGNAKEEHWRKKLYVLYVCIVYVLRCGVWRIFFLYSLKTLYLIIIFSYHCLFNKLILYQFFFLPHSLN